MKDPRKKGKNVSERLGKVCDARRHGLGSLMTWSLACSRQEREVSDVETLEKV
jgi:hypothetical protein